MPRQTHIEEADEMIKKDQETNKWIQALKDLDDKQVIATDTQGKEHKGKLIAMNYAYLHAGILEADNRIRIIWLPASIKEI